MRKLNFMDAGFLLAETRETPMKACKYLLGNGRLADVAWALRNMVVKRCTSEISG
jgi:hypothetical protein